MSKIATVLNTVATTYLWIIWIPEFVAVVAGLLRDFVSMMNALYIAFLPVALMISSVLAIGIRRCYCHGVSAREYAATVLIVALVIFDALISLGHGVVYRAVILAAIATGATIGAALTD